MAGLAGHEIPGVRSTSTYGRENALNPIGGRATGWNNGFQLSHEMTNLFEAALGSAGQNGPAAPNGAYVGLNTTQDGEPLPGVIGSNVFGGDEHLYRHMRELF